MTPRRRAAFLLAFALANAGAVIGYLPLLGLLLPLKVEEVAGAARLDLLTLCVVTGGVTASAANLLFGWLSDVAVAAGRGRRPVIVLGLGLLALGYGGVALAATPAAVVGAVIVVQLGVNAVLAPLLAIMADEVPDGQKGVAGGLLALAPPLGAALGALLVATSLGEGARLAIVPLVCAACLLPLLLFRAQPVDSAPAPAERPVLRRDLALAWVARLLLQVAASVLLLYLLYYFESIAGDRAGLPARVGRLTTLAYIAPLPFAVIAGRLSDASGRRKPFLLGAAIVAAAGLVGMAAARDVAAGAWAFTVVIVGQSVFMALHAGFAMQLLPDPRHRGRDLALLNLTNTLPALAGPTLVWLLATPHDFTALLMVLAGLTLAGGIILMGARARD